MTAIWAATVRLVIARAKGRCEYCRMHQSLQGASFHVEHIVPRIVGGADDETNLCLACPSCNLRKSSRTQGTDPESGTEVPLFHPRRDEWREHFDWSDSTLSGLTPIGRGTIARLELNAPRRLLIREAEMLFELFPPS